MKPEDAATEEESNWWQKRSVLEKRLVIAAGLGIVLFVIVIAVLLSVYYGTHYEVCTSPGCVRSSLQILDNIDTSVDPCKDFYQFACGKFLKNTILEDEDDRTAEDAAKEEIDVKLRKILERTDSNMVDPADLVAAKKFYRTCKNETAREHEGLYKIKEVFRKIGGWPLLDNHWDSNKFTWINAIHKLRREGISFDLFFKITVEKDKSSINDGYILALTNPSFSRADVEQIPLEYMINIAIEFGAEKTKAVREQRDVLTLLRDIAQLSERSMHNSTEGFVSSQTYTISQLQENFPGIRWWDYINGVLAMNYNINGDEKVLVSDPEYLRNVLKILNNYQKRTIANFMSWYTLQYVIQYLPSYLLDRVHHFAGVPRRQRWETCLLETHKRFSLTLSAAFAERSDDSSNRVKIIEMIRNIKEQFKYAIGNLDWMDEATKKRAREQITSSLEDIVTSHEIKEALAVENIYEKVEIDEHKYFETVLRIDTLLLNLKYNKLKQPARNTLWSCRKFPTYFDLVYLPRENTFKIPAGLMQGPFFATDRPNYLNYASLGSVIAREYSHLFTKDEYRNKDGRSGDWWSPHTLLNYDKKAQCVENRYGRLIVPETNTLILESRYQTNPEDDIADMAGAKISYEAYKKWVNENGWEPKLPGLNYTPQQLFWISSAIRHCAIRSPPAIREYLKKKGKSLERLRVNGPLSNLEYFINDFGCAVGSRMNLQDKCVVW